MSHWFSAVASWLAHASTLVSQQQLEWFLKNTVKIMSLSWLKGLSGFSWTIQTFRNGISSCLSVWPHSLCRPPQITLLQCCGGLECQTVPWPEDISPLTPALQCWFQHWMFASGWNCQIRDDVETRWWIEDSWNFRDLLWKLQFRFWVPFLTMFKTILLLFLFVHKFCSSHLTVTQEA